MGADVPVIFGRATTASAIRLYNAVISTGQEAIDIAKLGTPPTFVYDSANKLASRLEWLASGPKIKWENVVRAARRTVRKFIDQFEAVHD